MKIVFFIISVILLASCSHESKEKTYKPVILDEHKILNDSTVKAIENHYYPQGFLYIVRVVDSVEVDKIAAVADKQYRKDKENKPDYFGLYNRRVYVFVSKNPSLVQLRVEYDIRWGAYKKGIIAGPAYMAIQQTARQGNIDKSTLMMIDHAVKTIPEYWSSNNRKNRNYEYWHIFREYKYWLSTKLEMPRLPTGSFYSKYILRPIIQFQLRIGNIWISCLIFFLFVCLGIFILNALLFDLILKNRYDPEKNTKKLILGLLVLLITLIPAINSFAIFTSARVETLVKLELMQLNEIDSFIVPGFFHTFNTTWFILPVYFIIAIGALSSDKYENSKGLILLGLFLCILTPNAVIWPLLFASVAWLIIKALSLLFSFNKK